MTNELYDKYGNKINIPYSSNKQKDSGGGIGITIFWGVVGVCVTTLLLSSYQIFQIKMAGKSVTLDNMFKTYDQLNPKTEEEVLNAERSYYYEAAVKHYSETYSLKNARILASKDTNTYFNARRKGRDDSLKRDKALITDAENYIEQGGFIKNIVYLMSNETDKPLEDITNTNTNTDTNPLPLPSKTQTSTTTTDSFDIDLEAMKKPKKSGKYTVRSSIPNNIMSRKSILNQELEQKKDDLSLLTTKLKTSYGLTREKLNNQINRIEGDIFALQKELKM